MAGHDSALMNGPGPLGATLREGGVHFCVSARHAHAVDLCLFDSPESVKESRRVRLQRGERDLWSTFVPGLVAGAVYGFRVHGPWEPRRGMRHNAHKLLLDPYARAVVGTPDFHESLRSFPDPSSEPGSIDSAAVAMKSVVIDPAFDWGNDPSPDIPWRDTVIYEMHVKGFTQLHPKVPKPLRGTYAGLGHPAVTSYLCDLGVTSVQLLPVQQHLDDGFLLDKGLTNYWGYNTAAFFAPHNTYASSSDPQDQVREFKQMVKDLHAAGLEVILDVVYNHTAEGNEEGPMLMFRGLDEAGYYRLTPGEGTLHYENMTGCGNAVASHNPVALRLILDSLRYWVTEMHVDGFRFDLAVTVGRGADSYSTISPFFSAVAQDPVLSRTKLIAEPWDVGMLDSYQVGNFPEPWRELNGRYRDTTRKFWRGDEGATASFSKRLCGSEDIFAWNKRPVTASVNFITSHDGFTLRDLVTYTKKRNLDNGEDNHDGESENHAINFGVEGETDEPEVNEARSRIRRAVFASLFCSVGVPFINAGDERGRTQRGNNNAYCQDNDISWMDWSEAGTESWMIDFVKRLAEFRRRAPAIRRTRFFRGRINPETDRADVTWLEGDGGYLTHEAWHAEDRCHFGALIDSPDGIEDGPVAPDQETRPLLFLFGNRGDGCDFVLPGDDGSSWELVFDTYLSPSFPDHKVERPGGTPYPLAAGSFACLVLTQGDGRVIPPTHLPEPLEGTHRINLAEPAPDTE
jgi:glycogen operon protein